MPPMLKKTFVALIFLLVVFSLAKFSFANRVGYILENGEGRSYAQFTEPLAGTVNFYPNGESVYIDSKELRGYAWGDRAGWINLSPEFAGVLNDGFGELTGYAWGEIAGWINFRPTNGGVKIDTSNGYFQGWAWSENFGWLEFTCPGTACVQTTWRPEKSVILNTLPKINSVTFLRSNVVINKKTNTAVIEIARLGDDIGEASVVVRVAGGSAEYEPFKGLIVWEDGEGGTKRLIIKFKPEAFVGGEKSLVLELDEVDNLEYGRRSQITVLAKGDPAIIVKTKEVFVEVPGEAPGFPPKQTGGISSTGDRALIESIKALIKKQQRAETVEIFDIEIPGVTPDDAQNVLGTTTLSLLLASAAGISSNAIATASVSMEFMSGLSGLFLAMFARRRKRWGVVFDSDTKEPLDHARVNVYDLTGKKVATDVTDHGGNYGFVLYPGVYMLDVTKKGYKFPSAKLRGRSFDVMHTNLYLGERIEIKSDDIIDRNIPMDSEKEWYKKIDKTHRRYKWYNRLHSVSSSLLVIGLFLNLLVITIRPNIFNSVILLFYIFFSFLSIKHQLKSPGVITNAFSKLPFSFAIVRVFNASLNMVL